MKSVKSIVARDPVTLARALGLSEADAVQMSLRRQLNDKIIQAVKRSGLSHAEVATAAKMSRTRLTAILNRNTDHVSTELMLRILAALGYRPKITFVRARPAA
jgi:predicted XRE-type DNA-binding protein